MREAWPCSRRKPSGAGLVCRPSSGGEHAAPQRVGSASCTGYIHLHIGMVAMWWALDRSCAVLAAMRIADDYPDAWAGEDEWVAGRW